MTTISKADLFAGRKLLKVERGAAEAAAAQLIASDGAADELRNMLRFHYGLKSKHLDSLIVVPHDGGWIAMLMLQKTPRGMPNLIGAPSTYEDPDVALAAARQVLTGAMIMIQDYKAELRAGIAEKIRRFEYGDFAFGVPEEIISIIHKKLPHDMTEEQKSKIRKETEASLHCKLRAVDGSDEAWTRIDEESQVEIMCEAAQLLCVEVSSIEPEV
ncbi:hypothetical protein KUV57_12805 [Epibacterium sp. DP7N7-1]|nr:hypothetical protein [Epibacterium sp. DP7N7-1]